MMPSPADRETNLDYALAYGACDLRVLPIKPGTKRPPMREWVEAATNDAGIIRNWFTEPLYRDHGVGLAMGRQPDGRFIFALDIDEHDPAHSGGETLIDLIHEHGPLPETARSLTGSNGLHLLYAVPAGFDIEVRNGRAGDGIDVRGEGGQIVVAPTVHPTTGVPYTWEAGFAPWEQPIAEAPRWLLDLVAVVDAPLSPAPAPPGATPQRFADPDDGESPADWLRARWSWSYQLAEAGWSEHHIDRRTGETYWTRPGKETREGESAVLHMPDGPFVIWSLDPSMLVLRSVGRLNVDGSVSVSPFEFYAAYRHGGDLAAAGRAIRALMPAPAPGTDRRLAPAVSSTPDPASRKVRLTAASSIPLRRTRWLWDERVPMGALSLLAGPEGLGKSTVAFWMAARVTRGELDGEDWQQQRSVLVCATEDSWSQTIAPRLIAHDADLDRVFRIDVEVDGAIRAELSLPADLAAMEKSATDVNASMLILDPLMSRLDARLDSHRDGEVRTALEPLVQSCERAALACLGVIHFNKSNATNVLDQVMASKAFTAVARSVHAVIRDPDDDDVRLFGTIKNNLGRGDLPTRTFTIGSWTYQTVDDLGAPDGVGSVGKLDWGIDSTISVQTAARRAQDNRKDNPTVWLREYMAKHGPRVASSDLYTAADEAEIPRRALMRSRQKLRLDVEEAGGIGRGRQTYWFDPTDSRLSPTTETDTVERPW